MQDTGKGRHAVEDHRRGPVEGRAAIGRLILPEDLDRPAAMLELLDLLHDAVMVALRKVAVGDDDDVSVRRHRERCRQRVDRRDQAGDLVEAGSEAVVRLLPPAGGIVGARLLARQSEGRRDGAMRGGAPLRIGMPFLG